MRVDVDPTRRDDRAVGVDDAIALEPAAHRGDATVVYRDVTGEPIGSCAVDNRSAPDHQIVCHSQILSKVRVGVDSTLARSTQG